MTAPESNRKEDDKQDQFSPGDLSFEHDYVSPYKEEFSKFLKTVPEKLLWEELATQQQRNLAKSLWEASNYSGKPKPGQFKDMEPKRDYLEWVLRMDHNRQWQEALKKRYAKSTINS